MAITAKFVADFSDFQTGVTAAEAKLTAFGATASKTGDTVAKLALVTERGTTPFNSLRGSLSQFDGALASMGVNIGTEIRGLEELSTASGKTAKEIGLLGTAGLVTAAALGGWKLGRMISEFFALDEAIGNATAKLLGFGDVAAQTAGAVQDTINKALADGAPLGIKYAEAIQFNIKHLKEFQEGNKAGWALRGYIEQLDKASIVMDNLNVHQKGLIDRGVALNISHAEIAKGLGLTVDAVDTYIAALAKEATATKQAAADAKELAGVIAKLAKDEKDLRFDMKMFGVKQIKELTDAVQSEMEKQRGFVAAAQADLLGMLNASNAAKRTAALGGASSLDAQLEALAQSHQANIMKIEQAGRAASSQGGDAWLATQQRLTDEATSDFQSAWDKIVQGGNAAMGSVGAAVGTLPPAAAASAASVQQSFSIAFASIGNDADSMAARVASALHLADTNKQNSGFFGPNFGTADTINRMGERNAGLAIRGYASGGPVTQDGPIFAHAGEYVLPKGVGGGTTVYATVNITGQGASAGREAADALAARLKQTGRRI